MKLSSRREAEGDMNAGMWSIRLHSSADTMMAAEEKRETLTFSSIASSPLLSHDEPSSSAMKGPLSLISSVPLDALLSPQRYNLQDGDAVAAGAGALLEDAKIAGSTLAAADVAKDKGSSGIAHCRNLPDPSGDIMMKSLSQQLYRTQPLHSSPHQRRIIYHPHDTVYYLHAFISQFRSMTEQ